MIPFGKRLYASFMAEKQAKGRALSADEIIEVSQRTYDLFSKERKRADIHPDAESVYELYPKKCGKEDALRAISKALNKHPLSYLKDKTSQFARAVADWPQSYRFNRDGRDLCWNPATFYNDGHHEDDPATWKRHGARNSAPPPKIDLPEPAGWRVAFPDYIHVQKDWHSIDAASQAYIVEAMKQRAQA